MTAKPTSLNLPCPAKLNLFLTIRGRHQDGFHELGTLFHALEFGDTLHAEPSDRIEVVGGNVPGRLEDNLIFKAASLLAQTYAERLPPQTGIRFTLEKRIPMGAGFGGGSSDAASALQLANTLWGLNLERPALRALAPALGSDVAFFLFGNSAYAEGRGEILSPAPMAFPFYVLLATPNCHVNTPWAYQQFGIPIGSDTSHGAIAWNRFRASYEKNALLPNFYSKLHNDFENAVLPQFPEIQMVRDTLLAFKPEKAMLTGSGASLFALFKEKQEAQACLEAVAPLCRFSTISRFLSSFSY